MCLTLKSQKSRLEKQKDSIEKLNRKKKHHSINKQRKTNLRSRNFCVQFTVVEPRPLTSVISHKMR